MRIGYGYDVHRFSAGRKLVLGGVNIPFSKGLLGHSDADVLTHAIMDSMLGAAALGDIGTLFPDTDSSFKGADSLGLLKKVCLVLLKKGYKVVNIDSTIIAQKPKLQPYILQMRKNIAETCAVSSDCVSVKATTEEGLGFTGTLQGISAHAVCLIESSSGGK
jgi:2-C-methyl-D-erythritol 2,4-cyclodiphosphate synthase